MLSGLRSTIFTCVSVEKSCAMRSCGRLSFQLEMVTAVFIERGTSLQCILPCRWLRQEKKEKLIRKAAGLGSSSQKPGDSILPQWNNGFISGRMTSSLKDSSNAVMRM